MVDDPGGTPATQKVTIGVLVPTYGAQAARVATGETTTSTSYTDLSTGGPAVTVTVGNNGMVLVTIYCYGIASGNASAYALASVAISGANTVAAADAGASNVTIKNQTSSTGSTGDVSHTASVLLTGLTPGSTTFTMKYRVTAGTGTFTERKISVIPL